MQELIACFEDENAKLGDITQKIELDQVISARLLRLSNTARFGGARKIASVDDAVVRLGFDVIRTLVIASGLSGTATNIEGFDAEQFWVKTFQIAMICKNFAKDNDLSPEVAFTCGMMHSIGEIILAQYRQDFEKDGAVDFSDTLPSASLAGAELAKRWQFPDVITAAIRYQDRPSESDPVNGYAYLISLAKGLVNVNEQDEDAENIIRTLVEGPLREGIKISVESVEQDLLAMKEAGAEFAQVIHVA